jgi:predicted RNase H-like nuclease
VDGAPSGWCAVMVDMNGIEPPRAALYPDFSSVVAAGAQIIAVDMPIGFQDAPGETGMRACEQAARAVLGPRRSSVFPSPLRPALAAKDYREASALNRAAGGKGLSKQSFNLFAKMREIDALMTPHKESFVFETHPETSFALIAGHPAGHSKKTAEGREERLALLERHGLPRALFDPHPYRRKDANLDDLVDAGICALTALRVAAGTAVSLPEDPPRDGRGLRMAIFA